MVLMLLTGLLRKPFPDILTGVCQGVLRREKSSSTQAVLGYVGRQRTALYGLQEESQRVQVGPSQGSTKWVVL